VPKSDREYVKKKLARVEEDRKGPINDDDIRALIEGYRSLDPTVRARALEASCPCHVTWGVYEQLRKSALRLRRDPDPDVRARAIHLEADGRELESMEAAARRWVDDDEHVAARRAERRRRRRR
jgi:hypothetical protein